MKPKVLNSAKKAIYSQLKQLASEMRRKPTKAEFILWEQLRGKQLGVKFRRQHTIDKFIVDYYCVERNLVIEVDGCIHQEQEDKDKNRELVLIELGCSILRFSNEEIFLDMKNVLNRIRKILLGMNSEVTL
ncbi:MAG: endonuclease domain-containing protein [Candidatus Margulisiibacteriota bacterium]|jgi:ATP-dependent DNA helicase RecG